MGGSTLPHRRVFSRFALRALLTGTVANSDQIERSHTHHEECKIAFYKLRPINRTDNNYLLSVGTYAAVRNYASTCFLQFPSATTLVRSVGDLVSKLRAEACALYFEIFEGSEEC